MSKSEIKKLETHIDQMMEKVIQVKAENQSLQRRLVSSVQERARMQEKLQQVVVEVKRIISQLKEGLA